MTQATVPVLIAGAGPTGLVLAAELSRHGIACTLVERSLRTTRFPKMDITNGANMELLRRLGVDSELRARGVDAHYSFDVIFAAGLDGPELARWRQPSIEDQRALIASHADGSLPAEPWQRCSQAIFEAMMMTRAHRDPLIDVRQGWALERCTQSRDGVAVELTSTEGCSESMSALYVVGCDGHSSRVRTELGIGMEGMKDFTTFALVHFRSTDFANLHALGQFWHLFSTSGAVLIAQDETETWTLHQDLGDHSNDADPIGDPGDFVARALGRSIQIDEVLACSTWRPSALLADSYGHERIFLAGDAAHTMVPTGGYGMNTGVGDAINLGWKLAAAVQGWGGPHLLASYEVERAPVGERNRDISVEHGLVQLKYWEMADSALIQSDDAAGRAHREAIAEFLAANDGENVSLGVELDVRYDNSFVIVPDNSECPPWHRRRFAPTVRPGHRAPNVAIGREGTLFDRFGPGFTLVDAAHDKRQSEAMLREAARVGLPILHLPLTEPALMALYQHRMVLVRPDLHIAWSGTTVTDARSIVARVRGSVSRGDTGATNPSPPFSTPI